MAAPNPTLLREGDFPGMDKASGGELQRLFRAINGNHAEAAQAIGSLLSTSKVAWLTPTFVNGWINYGGTNPTAAYVRDSAGVVRLKGTVKSGTISLPIFQLPVGSRPGAALAFAVPSNGAFAQVNVDTYGNVTPLIGSNVWIDLAGITFLAEH